MEILHRDDIPRGGFAGVREHRLVMDPRAFGPHANPGTWPGIGNFVYLSDANFVPKGETKMHSHEEVDVISVMVEGRISHAGSLEHGQEVSANEVQVQRAGGESFLHNEINPDDVENRMIQIWVLSEEAGQPAGYKRYPLEKGFPARVYGGNTGQDETFASRTLIDVARLNPGENFTADGPFVAYLTRGEGTANEEAVSEGDLMRGGRLAFDASGESEDALLIVMHTMD
jgi:hypothetical protein